jgi:uncharacterized membrane protein YbhN (UPF0104 family)
MADEGSSSRWEGDRPSGRGRWLRLTLGTVLSAGVIYWLSRSLDVSHSLAAMRAARAGWLLFALVTVLLTLWARLLRWQVLLDSSRVSRSGILRALVLGQLVNLILPARLGDLGRAYLIAGDGYPSQARALGTLVVEKLWDVLVLVGLVLALSFWQSLPAWAIAPARLAAAMGGLLLAGVVILLLSRRRLSDLALFRRWPWLARLMRQLSDGLATVHRPRVMLAAGAWSLFVWLFGALTNLGVLKALGLPGALSVALFLLAVLQLGVAVPSVPGRIGVFEGLCVLALTFVGVDASLALAYGLVLHVVVLLPPVSLGLCWLVRLDPRARRAVWNRV